MTQQGITGVGTYLPRHTLTAEEVRESWGSTPPVSRVRVPSADEDAVTMAVEAADEALRDSGVPPEDLGYVGVASTTPPVEEGAWVSRVVRALGLPTDVRTEAASQDTASAADVLWTAANAEGPALAVAADAPQTEPGTVDAGMGAGAAAFVFGDGGVEVLGRGDYADEYPGVRFRRQGSLEVESIDITTYERDAVKECVSRAVRGLDVGDADRVAVHQPTPGLAGRITGALDLDAEPVTVSDEVGDLGAATVPLAVAQALSESGEDEVCVAGFFGGGARAAALAFRGGVGSAPELGDGESLSYSDYLRSRGFVAGGEVSGGGAHVSVPSWRRSLEARYRLVASRCPDCDALSYPPRGACRECGSRREGERVELPRSGEVVARTVIGVGGAPPEFADQVDRDGEYGVAIVELGGEGGSVWLPAQLTDCDPSGVGVGDGVEAVVRRIYEQEGVARYGVKFTPV